MKKDTKGLQQNTRSLTSIHSSNHPINSQNKVNNRNKSILSSDKLNLLDFVDPNDRELITTLSRNSQKNHEIDYVGIGTFNQTQSNLFLDRSKDLLPSHASQLSARGLLHRTSDNFEREVRLETLNISNLTMLHSKTEVGKGIVFPHVFHRAIAFERLGK